MKQYRATDLFVFALILAVSELLSFLAGKWFPAAATYTFSLLVPVTLVVMMRWSWQSVLYAVLGGLFKCLLFISTVNGVQFATYIIGNAFIALMLIPVKLIGKDKIRSKWWASALLFIGGWLCVYLGRATIWAIGYSISPVANSTAWNGFVSFALSELFSLVIGLVLVLVLRRIDGMFEDQIIFLKRLDKERKERMRIDQFGENDGIIDEESFNILKKDNDLF
ncbi:MAG: hypothetical protein NC033_00145 [Clostridiales bacterium]|nr:hypothetical protein [Clostridiales bacterium]